MGSALGPLIDKLVMNYIEENLRIQDNLQAFYRRYFDGTLKMMSDVSFASYFLIVFTLLFCSTMSCKKNNFISIFGLSLFQNKDKVATKNHVKPMKVDYFFIPPAILILYKNPSNNVTLWLLLFFNRAVLCWIVQPIWELVYRITSSSSFITFV